MDIIGHEEVRLRLENLAPITLLEGPDGIGKRLLAREAAERVAQGPNLLEVGEEVCTRLVSGDRHTHLKECFVLTERVADVIVHSCRIRGRRAFVFDAGRATTGAANSLLKVLEEPPPDTYFVMYASRLVLPTIASRADRIPVHPLTDEQVYEALILQGAPEERSRIAARLSAGRVGHALDVEQMLVQKGVVIQMLKGAAQRDRELMAAALGGLMPRSDEDWYEVKRYGEVARARHTLDLLRQALVECRTENFVVFTPEETFGLYRLTAESLDAAIRTCGSRARPLLTCRVVLDGLSTSQRRR